MSITLLRLAAPRGGFWEMTFLNSVVESAVHDLATRRRCRPTFASRPRVPGSARELRRSLSGRGARAGLGVTPRLVRASVLRPGPQPLRFNPGKRRELKWRDGSVKRAEKRDSGLFSDIRVHVFQVWVGCARRGSTSGGCEHGLEVGDAAARSAPVGLLLPHGQNQNSHVAAGSALAAFQPT